MKKKGVQVVSRDKISSGLTTGGEYRCRMSGCNGIRVGTRWSDGKLTYPCTKGMEMSRSGQWRIM